MTGLILSILMLAGMALLAGGAYLLAKRRDRKRGVLMLIAAVVMFGNVAVWLMPTPDGRRLSTSETAARR